MTLAVGKPNQLESQITHLVPCITLCRVTQAYYAALQRRVSAIRHKDTSIIPSCRSDGLYRNGQITRIDLAIKPAEPNGTGSEIFLITP